MKSRAVLRARCSNSGDGNQPGAESEVTLTTLRRSADVPMARAERAAAEITVRTTRVYTRREDSLIPAFVVKLHYRVDSRQRSIGFLTSLARVGANKIQRNPRAAIYPQKILSPLTRRVRQRAAKGQTTSSSLYWLARTVSFSPAPPPAMEPSTSTIVVPGTRISRTSR